MGSGLVLETTFLVDLERELRHGGPGPAQAFLEQHANDSLFITFTVAGEMAAGLGPADRPRWEQFVAPFEVLPATAAVTWSYGQTYRYLKTNGHLIGANDLWIAVTALAFEKAVVTRNTREYQRVPGLRVVSYRS